MYILYNSISYATGRSLGSHSIGWPTLSNTSQAAQRRCATNPEGRFLPGFPMLFGVVGIFGAVPVPLFGLPPFRCSASAHALRVGLLVGGPLPSASARSSALSACSPAPALPVGIVCASSPLSALATIHVPALLRSAGYPALPRTMCVYPTLLLYAKRQDGHGDCNGPAVNLLSAAVICSAPALTLCPRYANDAHTLCRLRSAVCRLRDCKGNGKGKGNGNGKGNSNWKR